jgi:hypothetical protein
LNSYSVGFREKSVAVELAMEMVVFRVEPIYRLLPPSPGLTGEEDDVALWKRAEVLFDPMVD